MDMPLQPNPMQPPRPPIPPGPTGMATTRPDNAGMKMRAHPQVTIATKFLETALKAVGATSPEGLALMKALEALAPHFGQASGDITKAESKMVGDKVNPTGAPGPENLEAMKKALSQKMQSSGGPLGAASPPMPAPAAA